MPRSLNEGSACLFGRAVGHAGPDVYHCCFFSSSTLELPSSQVKVLLSWSPWSVKNQPFPLGFVRPFPEFRLDCVLSCNAPTGDACQSTCFLRMQALTQPPRSLFFPLLSSPFPLPVLFSLFTFGSPASPAFASGQAWLPWLQTS